MTKLKLSLEPNVKVKKLALMIGVVLLLGTGNMCKVLASSNDLEPDSYSQGIVARAAVEERHTENEEGLNCLSMTQNLLVRLARGSSFIIKQSLPVVQAGSVIGIIPQSIGSACAYLTPPFAVCLENIANYCSQQEE